MDKTGTGSCILEDNPPTCTVKNCHPNLKMFLAALSNAYFAKALSGSYMKSTITQLERRFDIPSYLIGIIDGSFEMGNLLVIAFVSYFGAKLHRPKIIAIGCILMSLGTFLIAMPHFIIGHYKIETTIRASENSTSQLSPCPVRSSESSRAGDGSSSLFSKGCEQESSILMWMFVLLGNVLRGIGETPVQPLGISYIDDFAESENAALYIGCVQTISIIGPVFGFLLGSLCAKIYVDVGYVDMETITITPEDARWVGAWWLGYLIAGTVTLLSAVPFWFLPKSLPMPVDKHDSSCTPEQTRFIKDADSPTLDHKIRLEEPANLHVMANEFVPTLKTLLGNPVYILYLGVTVIQFNSLIGMVTYKPKYIEQHYGQSASKANFFMGMINIPAVALGMFSGGVVIKKYKLGVMGAAKLAFGTSLLGFFLSFLFLAMGCENSKVAGITVSYTGEEDLPYQEQSLFSDCNSGCLCSTKEWDPVCGENGITYVSPCLAGCTSSRGSGRNMVFDHCSSFIISLGGTPGLMLLVRCIKPELKSLALGIHTLATRTLAGIPAPIYFGAIIDTTCLKWAYNTCGGRGACRIYNTSSYRIVYLGLTLGLRAVSFFLCIWGFDLLRKHIKREKKALSNDSGELEFLRKENGSATGGQFLLSPDCNPERETRL
ncbi:solute carrier organic anion transporter family member 1C1-like isoform X1 [Girardinichthys multiradiatus]|uniref:solute carrier organic anion transporter family member 1C1-like isoform X1 n=1 Tax=Girardinichthys multiradiatus TaxID=208333 RepID=UPI001FACFD7E|nr:solute carrier organic anion transporter family member 1C1-like isoform X1 [Girardinichthys multiradiatus]